MSSEISGLPATVFTFRMKLQNGKPGEMVNFVVASKGETWALSLVGPRKPFHSRDGIELICLQDIADSFQFLDPVSERIKPTVWEPGTGQTPKTTAAAQRAQGEPPVETGTPKETGTGQGGRQQESSQGSESQPSESAASARIQVGGKVMHDKLIYHPDPKYPAFARIARLEGQVRFVPTIGTDGRVEDLEILRGHPLLVRPALEAVGRWRYAPTLVNGKPVEVVREIDLNFTLSEN